MKVIVNKNCKKYCRNFMALFTDKWVRVFDISETSSHVKGFTLYKIVSIVYPKSCPDAVTKVTVWKRYNDFKKLHRDLKYRHKSMHIEDKYPVLPSSSYFKRFDSEVINQRKNNVLLFLEYVALHPSLFKSTEFVKFFETSHTPQESLNSNINIIRAQLNLPNDPEILYPYNSDDDPGHSDSDSISTFSIASTSIIQIDESILESRSNSSHTNLNQILESPHSFSSNSKVSLPESVSNKSLRNVYPTPPSTPEDIKEQTNSPSRYLNIAAEYITKATEFEADKKFQESFTAYKAGISSLLEGVKGDNDSNRRQMVKYKIEKYLLRAEKIYNLHLSPEITRIKNICKNDNDITAYSIKRPMEDLYNYKVLKLLESGMVVLHRKEHNVFYMKVTQKSLQMSESIYLNIPKDVPYMVKLFQYYDSPNAIFIVTQYVSGGTIIDHIKQKNGSTNDHILTTFSSVTFDKDILDSPDGEFDGACSDSSECSYSDLITNYTSKKFAHSSSTISKDEKDSTEKNSNSDTEGSSINSKSFETDQKETSDNSFVFVNHSQINLIMGTEIASSGSASKPSQRTISEKSYTEEFSSVNYIPPLEDIVKWAAQLLLAIDKLHKVGIVICNLNPQKLLLDERGNLLLTFVCNFREKGKLFLNKFENNLYCAPEVFGLQHVTFAADWWSYGAILFEILTGMSLRAVHPEGICSYTILKIPKYVSAEGKSLLRQILVYEPHERLGCGINGTDDIKSHPFFNAIDWMRFQIEAFKT